MQIEWVYVHVTLLIKSSSFKKVCSSLFFILGHLWRAIEASFISFSKEELKWSLFDHKVQLTQLDLCTGNPRCDSSKASWHWVANWDSPEIWKRQWLSRSRLPALYADAAPLCTNASISLVEHPDQIWDTRQDHTAPSLFWLLVVEG